MRAMEMGQVIDVGEAGAAMNGAVWAASPRWPLLEKMQRSDFTAARVARVEGLPKTDVAWAEPSKRPAQAAIRGGSAGVEGALLGVNVGGTSTADALSLGNRRTDTALVLANAKTTAALGEAAQSTGKALSKSAGGVRNAVGSAWRHTGGAMTSPR
jgi:hypothetical protein